MAVKIVRATSAHKAQILSLLEQVLAVHHQIRPDLFLPGAKKYTSAELEVLLQDDSTPVFVALGEGEEVLGYIFLQFICHEHDNILTPIRTVYIDDLCVREDAQGKGVGRALCAYALEFAAAQGFYNLTLNVWAGNDKAKAFYERMGFTPQKYGLEIIV